MFIMAFNTVTVITHCHYSSFPEECTFSTELMTSLQCLYYIIASTIQEGTRSFDNLPLEWKTYYDILVLSRTKDKGQG